MEKKTKNEEKNAPPRVFELFNRIVRIRAEQTRDTKPSVTIDPGKGLLTK